MAGTSSVVVGSIDIKDLFHDIVTFLNTIHISQENGQPVSQCFLQVAMFKLRLSRWCSAIVEFTKANDEPTNNQSLGEFLRSDLLKMKNMYEEDAEETNATPTTAPNDWMVRRLNNLSRAHYRLPRSSSPSTRSCSEVDCDDLMAGLAGIMDGVEGRIKARKFSNRLAEMRLEDAGPFLAIATKSEVLRLRESALLVDREFATLLFDNGGGHKYQGIILNGRGFVGDRTYLFNEKDTARLETDMAVNSLNRIQAGHL